MFYNVYLIFNKVDISNQGEKSRYQLKIFYKNIVIMT